MPTDVTFHLPFSAPRPNPSKITQAGLRGVRWACDHGLIESSEKAIAYYKAMRLADVAAGFCPDAAGKDLDVITDVITWTAVCDDYFDGPAGDDLWVTADAVDELYDITRPGRTAPRSGSPLAGATADLWSRMREPMSEAWRERAGRNWGRFLRSFLAEAEARRNGVIPGFDEYIALRRETMAMYIYLDAAERANHYEVPERVLAGSPMRRLAELEIDIIAHCNDVHSIEHEEARGDTHNLVLVLEKELKYSRADVIAEIQRRVHDLSEEFLRTAAGIPELCSGLACTEAERVNVERHVLTMTHQIRVTHDWSLETQRYAAPVATQSTRQGVHGRRPSYLLSAERSSAARVSQEQRS